MNTCANDSYYTNNRYHIQIRTDNYDITHNIKVKEKYPQLYQEVVDHDKVSTSSWYDLSHAAFLEFEAYVNDDSLGYVY